MDAIITHDTKIIVDANEAACELFGQDRDLLIDGNLLEGVSNGDMKFLVKLRLFMARKKGEAPREKVKFARQDGTIFWAWATTQRRADGFFDTTLIYIGECDA